MKKESKLDPFAERLDEWLGEKNMTYDQVRAQLRLDGCDVSSGRLSEWWQARRSAKQQRQLISQIVTGARAAREVETEFGQNPAPELDVIIKLLRVLILQFSTEANDNRDVVKQLSALMKPVMVWAQLQEHARDREFEETKYKQALKSKLDVALDEMAATLKQHPDLLADYQAWRERLNNRIAHAE
jgi:hypothetical protein